MRVYSNNAVLTNLAAGVGTDDTTIEVLDTSGWPEPEPGDSAVASIGYGDQASVEVITYTGKTDTSLTGVTRGRDGTQARAHSAGAAVAHVASAKDVELVRAIELAMSYGELVYVGDTPPDDPERYPIWIDTTDSSIPVTTRHGDLLDANSPDAHPQYATHEDVATAIEESSSLSSEQQLRTDAEQNIRLWQLEANVVGATEGMDGWVGEAFLTGQDELEEVVDLSVTRALRIGDGYLTLATGGSGPITSIAMPQAKTITRIVYHNNKWMVFGEDGAFYVSLDDGATWTDHSVNVTGLTFTTSGGVSGDINGYYAYGLVGTTFHIIMTPDNGVTWNHWSASRTGLTSVYVTSISGVGIFAYGYGGFRATTLNGGATWTNNSTGSNRMSAPTRVPDSTKLFQYEMSGTNATFYVSSNNGVSWTSFSGTTGSTGNDPTSSPKVTSSGVWLVAAISGYYRSTNGGSSFTKHTLSGRSGASYTMTIDGDTVVWTDTGRTSSQRSYAFVSTNAGSSILHTFSSIYSRWTVENYGDGAWILNTRDTTDFTRSSPNNGTSWYAVTGVQGSYSVTSTSYFGKIGNFWYVRAMSGRFAYSTNGSSWTYRTLSTTTYPDFYSSPAKDANGSPRWVVIWERSSSTGGIEYTNNLSTWASTTLGERIGSTISTTGRYFLVGINGRMRHFLTDTTTFSISSVSTPFTSSNRPTTSLGYINDVFYLRDSSGNIHRSTNGTSWTVTQVFSTGYIYGIRDLGEGVLILTSRVSAGQGVQIARSTNNGASWSIVATIPHASGYYLSGYTQNGSTVIASGNSGIAAISYNRGATWSDFSGVSTITVSQSSGVWYVAANDANGNYTIRYSEDNGANWTTYTNATSVYARSGAIVAMADGTNIRMNQSISTDSGRATFRAGHISRQCNAVYLLSEEEYNPEEFSITYEASLDDGFTWVPVETRSGIIPLGHIGNNLKLRLFIERLEEAPPGGGEEEPPPDEGEEEPPPDEEVFFDDPEVQEVDYSDMSGVKVLWVIAYATREGELVA